MTPSHCYGQLPGVLGEGGPGGERLEKTLQLASPYCVPGWSPSPPTSHLIFRAFDYLMHGLFFWLG